MRSILGLTAGVVVLLSASAYAQVSINIQPQPTGMRLSTPGAPAGFVTFEGTASLDPGSWDILSMVPSSDAQAGWVHSQSTLLPLQFYRAQWQADYLPAFAENFRLIDTSPDDRRGKSRELFYYFTSTNVKAFVLVFTGNGCASVRQYIPTLNAQRNRFGPQGVIYWMIDSNLQDNRSNIWAEATAWNINLPILHDPAQVVARAYNASKTPEVVCVNKEDFTVFYRGSIDDRLGANATASTQHYLSNAVVRFLAGQPVSPIQTGPAGCDISLAPRYESTYSQHIAPILQNKCFYCHSPGNIAPFAMTNHAVISNTAPTIKENVMAGHMPPWFADPYYGRFSNDRSLTPEETARLVQWIDDGALRGTGPDPLESATVPVGYPFAWPESLGTPDQILSIPVQNIKATGVEAYRYTNVTTTFATDVWLRAAVVKPGNIRVVHHVLVFDGQTLGGLAGFFSGYVPGTEAVAFPPGTGKLLRAGQELEFQMHYITIGTPQTDQTQIGLYVSPSPPTYPLQTKSTFDTCFNIPANTPNYERVGYVPQAPLNFCGASGGGFSTDIMLYEMSPHMHLRGSHFKYEVIYPDNSTEVLLSVPHYVFHWQTLYRLTTPKRLPRGSRIKCTAGWDNTEQNSHLMEEYNATRDARFLPNRNVGFGEQSYDEMFIGYLNYAELP
jgi:hypothetical protein